MCVLHAKASVNFTSNISLLLNDMKHTIKTHRRNFHKGNYKDRRKYLTKLDWNNMLMNKTAIKCWNILKYKIESIIDKFAPLKKQGKRSRKKHLSKEAIRKIVLKQTMWRVYRRTRKD